MTIHDAFSAFGALAVVALLVGQVFAQGDPHAAGAKPAAPPSIDAARYRVYTSTGKAATLDDVVAAAGAADVLFVGEEHDDPGAHFVEYELLRRAAERYGADSKRQVVLSLEMFERDVQPIVDEYLGGLITESHFLKASRPWNNYQSDYRPLVEYAREHKLPVVAANAPQRYANRASRLGRASLAELSPAAKQWLAPLPYGEPVPAYREKFEALMGDGHGAAPNMPAHIIDGQALWDATMAYSISQALARAPNALVVHANGKFHSEERLGVPAQLLRYTPKARLLVVTVVSTDAVETFDAAELGRLGDFVVMTDVGIITKATA
jgi:uncharacterized iron-regulated protein